MQKDGNDENSDNSNVTVGDEDAKLSRKVEKRKKKLQHEEDRLNQMRYYNLFAINFKFPANIKFTWWGLMRH
jgi:hypothetical protein